LTKSEKEATKGFGAGEEGQEKNQEVGKNGGGDTGKTLDRRRKNRDAEDVGKNFKIEMQTPKKKKEERKGEEGKKGEKTMLRLTYERFFLCRGRREKKEDRVTVIQKSGECHSKPPKKSKRRWETTA